MKTVLSSETKTIVISSDNPFVIIGERINPTGRKKLAKELAAGDFSRVRADALAQVEAGAHVPDVNSGRARCRRTGHHAPGGADSDDYATVACVATPMVPMATWQFPKGSRDNGKATLPAAA